jgi:hypothetical protein
VKNGGGQRWRCQICAPARQHHTMSVAVGDGATGRVGSGEKGTNHSEVSTRFQDVATSGRAQLLGRASYIQENVDVLCIISGYSSCPGVMTTNLNFLKLITILKMAT